MGGYHYTEKMLFVDTEDGEVLGWTSDCNGKKDFDPVIVRISSRVYSDGRYVQTIILGGDDEIANTGIQQAPSGAEARATIEKMAESHADKIIAAVRAAYRP